MFFHPDWKVYLHISHWLLSYDLYISLSNCNFSELSQLESSSTWFLLTNLLFKQTLSWPPSQAEFWLTNNPNDLVCFLLSLYQYLKLIYWLIYSLFIELSFGCPFSLKCRASQEQNLHTHVFQFMKWNLHIFHKYRYGLERIHK